MKISIVMAYYNRKELLRNTLDTIAMSKHSPEIIIVDDASNEDNRIEDIVDCSELDINLIRVEPEEKTWSNTCIPYNMGIRAATGDVIMIQNAENLHIGDVISHVISNITEGIYIAFACYSIDKELLAKIFESNLDEQNIRDIISPTIDIIPNDGENGWYCHSEYNPSGHPFCAALTRQDMELLDGFDETYAEGLGYEDMEFLRRIREREIEIEIYDSPFVVHQAHTVTDYKSNQILHNRNERLYATGQILDI
jgi:glycosyltransferase involved in cell wall biosynthesis